MPSVAILTAFLLQLQALPVARDVAPAPSPAALAADAGALRHPNGRVPPVVTAVRASAGTPHLHGRLDDATWTRAEPVSGFTQRYPRDGQPASESTVVRLAYDDSALYVSARMYDAEPSRIVAESGPRDSGLNDDHFEFAIDTEHDHRTAFFFKVDPLGVQNDAVVLDDGADRDATYDPMWDVATQRDSLGWTVECRIPYTQLRFANAPVQTWGINFNRHIGRTGEDSFWARIGQADSGFSSFFGHVHGIANLPQMPHLKTRR